MSRPKKYHDERVSTSLRLPADLHQRLQSAAEDRDLSVNWLATKAIAVYLDRLSPAEADQ